MYLFDFIAKLQKLNPNLYANLDRKVEVSAGWTSTALCLKKVKRKTSIAATGLNYVTGDQRNYLQAGMDGHIDEYLGGIPLGWVPEYDVIDPDEGKVLARGWRTIVYDLVKKGHAKLDKARSLFSASLGESDYDRLSYEAKRRLAREAA